MREFDAGFIGAYEPLQVSKVSQGDHKCT